MGMDKYGCFMQMYEQGREEQSLIQWNTDIMLLASLIVHVSIAKMTAQLLSLSYGYFI